MRLDRIRRTEQVNFSADPELRAAIEREAARRESSMSSTVRYLIRAQLAAMASAGDNRRIA